uniref:UVI-1 n=1 Tax=Zoysia japonica TaxID=309978 RepID=A0A516UX42_9POAL|nr:UVI-1 [Zoysia japonica]
MQFSVFNLAIAALAVCGDVVHAAITPAQTADNIKMLTEKSQALQAPAQSITIINGPLIVVGQGPFPTIINGFAEIITIATTSNAQMQGSSNVPAGADADLIFDAFREFVRVHQVLLNILIGKAGLFTTVPIIGQPIATVLRQLEAIVDTIAFQLIDTVQGRSKDLTTQANSLSMTLTTAINSYDGLSV